MTVRVWPEIAAPHARALARGRRYQRFIGLWKNADPELQPTVREVRQRLARLRAGDVTLAAAAP